MQNCIFCAIANKKSPAELEYEDEEIVAFQDIHPKTTVHILIVPKKHIPSITALGEDDICLIGRMVYVAKKIAEDKGIADDGYRLVFNVGRQSGQMVDHIHLHLIGGEKLGNMV